MYVDMSRSSAFGFNEVGLLDPGLSTAAGRERRGRGGRRGTMTTVVPRAIKQ